MDNYKNSPVITTLANKGVPWAIKFKTKTWQALTPNQKKLAREALGMNLTATVIIPKRARGSPAVAKPNRLGPGTAGKTSTCTGSELLLTLPKQTGYTPLTKSWILNPGQYSPFRRASLMSSMYNKYMFTNIKVRWTTTASFESSGRIVLAYNSDSSDPVPTKAGIVEFKTRAENVVTTSFILDIPGDGKYRYCRDSTSNDPKLVDFGRLIVMHYGAAESDSAYLGEVLVDYTVVFSEPIPTGSITQQGEQLVSDGPGYAFVTVQPTTFRLTIYGEGKWLVVWQSSTATPDVNIKGDGAKAHITSSADSKTVIAVVTAELEGAYLESTTLAAVSGLKWYVSRL
ncbi:coat protein [Calibrachoa mottle virus]|uniref:Capsid protein n=1 Tax=Calibrachoa mottle virus TaxID=204928 RepID=C7E3L5_9TOMB|nr:coat protein [Calibrachoa mottle virus]ACT36598.1 coat protein [Calibrachoa mottle virus]WIW79832.1 capsid protein [Calibrachoa mottle virus]